MSSNEQDPILISQIIHEVSFPVYGLIHHPLKLTICSVSYGSFNDRRISVGFTFSSHINSLKKDQKIIEITSSETNIQGIVYPSKSTPSPLLFDLDKSLFIQYDLNDEVLRRAGTPQIIEQTWTIANTLFSGEVRHWTHPYLLSRFSLFSQRTQLTGSAFGASLQELLSTICSLVIINQYADLLIQYQNELEQETKRIWDQSS